MKRHFKHSHCKITALISSALLLLASCSGLFNQSSENFDDGKAYISIGVSRVKRYSDSKTYYPTSISPDELINFRLTGLLEGEDSEKLLATAESITKFEKLEITPGAWTFTLSATYNGITYADTVRYNINYGNNRVSFELKSTAASGNGGFNITVDLSSDTNADLVKATLSTLDGSVKETKTFDFAELPSREIIYSKKNLDNDEESLSPGTYHLLFEFFAKNGSDENIVLTELNQWESYICILSQVVTEARISLNLNEVYTIEYYNQDQEPINFVNYGFAGTAIEKYSVRSHFTLPVLVKEGNVFLGWYETDDLGNIISENKVTEIEAGTTGNKKFKAQFFETVIYVSGTGDDTTGDGTQANPFESVDKACEYIIEHPFPTADWIIYIMGDVTGPHNSTKKAGERSYAPNDYGRSNIPETLTSEHAKSILLIGANEVLDANDNPQDMIDRGLSLSNVSSTETGTALAIFTEVPVTIKNLKITNGSNSLTPSSTGIKGGGIHISSNSTVTFDDDTLIINNGYRSCGGIFNEGTLYIVGRTYIGDRTSTTIADGYSNCSNAGAWGAGLYNKGTVYLGTEEKELEGGIYHNYGESAVGGGIYNECGTIEMRSGTIAYNKGSSSGGGVYIKAGTFNMSGGSIHHNFGGSGGGVYIDSGATFIFSGGTISANWANIDGGAVYIGNSESVHGIMYMYGTAVIGDKTKTSAPTSRTGANACGEDGAGIYVNGYLYMGYSSYTSETEYKTADLTDGGGIYYSYNESSTKYGGALYINGGSGTSSSSLAHARIRSGTIANNYAVAGGAAYLSGVSTLVLGGNVKIPSGAENKNDIKFAGSYHLFVEDSLSGVSPSDPIYLTPAGSTSYYDSAVMVLATNSKLESIAEVAEKFAISPLANPTTGIVTHWILDESSGKAVQNATYFYVASISKNGSDDNTGLATNSPFASISKAIEKINELDTPEKDYTIEINGEILGPQSISDISETETIKANSIYIKGKNSSSATLSDIINANLGENESGSALTIDTKVPVTLYYIGITGGHGNLIGSGANERVAGGGLYIGKNATVSLEGKTHIYENTNYYGSTTVSGAGGGVYIGENSIVYIPGSGVQVRENKGTHYGAGVYIDNGAYVKITEAAKIQNNSFDDRFRQSGQAVDTYGGGVYLADNATLEMTNGTISGNNTNSTGSSSCRGNGVFVSGTTGTPAILKMGKLACIGIENDIFLQNNVPITIISTLTTYSTHPGRITPENYPSSESEEITLITVPDSGVSISSAASSLEITPQSISGGEKQYWYLNSTGKLAKRAGMGLTITIVPDLTSDIAVTVTQGGTALNDTVHIIAGESLTFTAPSTGYTYKWTVDNEQKSTTNTLTIDTSDWSTGTYDVYLEAKDSNNKYYSYTAQIKVNN